MAQERSLMRGERALPHPWEMRISPQHGRLSRYPPARRAPLTQRSGGRSRTFLLQLHARTCVTEPRRHELRPLCVYVWSVCPLQAHINANLQLSASGTSVAGGQRTCQRQSRHRAAHAPTGSHHHAAHGHTRPTAVPQVVRRLQWKGGSHWYHTRRTHPPGVFICASGTA